jgi:L-malate glycosyltransferase
MSTPVRPRLLEVLYSFRVGGSELLGLELARQLSGRGVHVMCTALEGVSGPLVRKCEEYGIEVVDLGLPKHGVLARNGVSLDLARRIRALGADAAHFQHFLGLHKLGLPARLAGVRRIVVTEHSVLDASQSRAGRFRIRLNWRMADAITVVHPQIEKYLVEEIGIDAHRVAVVPVGIELDRWHASDRLQRRREFGYGDEFVFAFVGRFAPVKAVPALVSSFLVAQTPENPRMRLALVGDGEDMAECRRIADSHPHGSKVCFFGELDDARPVLAAADGFVMNSLSEGTPRALLEAMSTGLACVCPAVGGIPSLLESRGWLFPVGDQAGLIGALVEVALNPGSAMERGSSGRGFVARAFDSRRICDQYRQLLFP